MLATQGSAGEKTRDVVKIKFLSKTESSFSIESAALQARRSRLTIPLELTSTTNTNMTDKVLPSCIPLPLEPAELDEIVSKAKDYALMHGICMRSKAAFNPDTLQVSRLISRSSSSLSNLSQ